MRADPDEADAWREAYCAAAYELNPDLSVRSAEWDAGLRNDHRRLWAGGKPDHGLTEGEARPGAANGSGRTPFGGNVVPPARISPIIKKIVDLTPAQNLGTPTTMANNFFANGPFIYDRHVLDTKFTAHATEKLKLSARVSYLKWNFDNPPLFGQLGGTGSEGRGSYEGQGTGNTVTMTYSGAYTLTPAIVIDGSLGYTLIDNAAENIRLDEKPGLALLGIPGTNGPNRDCGGGRGSR